ncbi:MAG TPA: glycosyltransferase [Tepidisphaeraceae bacterium]|nr:glycosyltransferase [Tepidisphaeraceae bacterium]
MIRVLHLVEVGADFQTERGAMQLAMGLGEGFETEVRTIGPGGDWPQMIAAARGMRKVGGFDLVHAWGTRALTAAVMGGRGPVIYSPAADLQRRGAKWLGAIMQYRDVEVVAPSATLRKALVRSGVAVEKCHLIRPGVDFGRIKRRNAQMREALGLGKDDLVLLASGESTRGANHQLAAWTVAILAAMDERWKLILWGRGPRADRVKEFARRVYRGKVMWVAEEERRRVEYEELLGACDMVLNTAKGAAATLPLAMAMAAAVPIISTVTYAVGELLEDHHNALLVPRASARRLAQRVMEMNENSGLKWRLTDMGRTEAYDYFSLTRFLEQWRAVYRQCAAGEAVKVVERAGAGARFHGRV